MQLPFLPLDFCPECRSIRLTEEAHDDNSYIDAPIFVLRKFFKKKKKKKEGKETALLDYIGNDETTTGLSSDESDLGVREIVCKFSFQV